MKYQNENFNGQFDFRRGFHDGWVMESHLHEYSELLYCKEGVGTVWINETQIQLPPNHIVWIPPNYIHQYACENAQVYCSVFSNDFIPLFFHSIKEKRLKPSAINISDMREVLEQFFLLNKEQLLQISGYLNLISARVLSHSDWEETKQTDGILYQKVISYISEHFREDLSIKFIAKKFGYNEKYLSHCLHNLTGVHFSKLLALYRLEYARKLLLTNQKSNISQIAQDSGFSSLNTFNRLFKENTGMTPSQYKKTAGQV